MLSTKCIFKYNFTRVDWLIGSHSVFLIMLANQAGSVEKK